MKFAKKYRSAVGRMLLRKIMKRAMDRMLTKLRESIVEAQVENLKKLTLIKVSVLDELSAEIKRESSPFTLGTGELIAPNRAGMSHWP